MKNNRARSNNILYSGISIIAFSLTLGACNIYQGESSAEADVNSSAEMEFFPLDRVSHETLLAEIAEAAQYDNEDSDDGTKMVPSDLNQTTPAAPRILFNDQPEPDTGLPLEAEANNETVEVASISTSSDKDALAETSGGSTPPLPRRKPLEGGLGHTVDNRHSDADTIGANNADTVKAVPPLPKRKPLQDRTGQNTEDADPDPDMEEHNEALSSPLRTKPDDSSLNVTMAPEDDIDQIRDLVKKALDREVDEEPIDEAETDISSSSDNLGEGEGDSEKDTPVIMPDPFDFTKWDSDNFIGDFESSKNSLLTALEENGEANLDLLDMALLYAAHGMAHESLSLLDEVDPDNLNGKQNANYMALKEIMTLWLDRPNENDYAILGNEEYSDWADYAPWTAYNAAQEERWVRAGDLASEGLSRLSSYPDVIKLPLLIKLTEALAMTGGEVREVEQALHKIDEMARDPHDRSALGYLTALVAEAMEEDRSAFEAYVAASRGEGPYAQKARIATVEIGLNRDEMTLEEANTLLSDSQNLWRGDGMSIEIDKRLAAIRYELGDVAGTLVSLASILTNTHANEATLEQAAENIKDLLPLLYEEDDKGNKPIAQRMEEHERLKHAFADHEIFLPYRDIFAEDLSEANLNAAASREYTLLADISEGQDKVGYRLMAVEKLVDGGGLNAAEEMLSEIDEPEDADLSSDWGHLKARIAHERGTVSDLAWTPGSDVKSLQLLGDESWAEEDWESVKSIYQDIRTNYPESFGETEVLRLLISSYRTADVPTFMDVSRNNADQIGKAEWRQLAQMLIDGPPSISPLGSDEAHEIISQAEGVRNLVQQALNEN